MGFNENTSATMAESMDVAWAAPPSIRAQGTSACRKDRGTAGSRDPTAAVGVGVCISLSAHNTQVLHWLRMPKTHNFLIILNPILFNTVWRELQNYSILITERLGHGDKIHVAMCGLATYKCIQTE